MTYINKICADAGTVNCPCPLADTGDCLVCSRLAGKQQCDCTWAGLCIYNEYIHNGRVVRNPRENITSEILEKTWYGEDLLLMVLQVPKGMALSAASPGSFIFLKPEGVAEFCNTPVSVMFSDMEKGRLYIALKVISSKTKLIAESEGKLEMRGVYRNGLLGGGLAGLAEDIKAADKRKRWLIMTKGVGFAPAINLLHWAANRVDVRMVIDTEKINEEMVADCFRKCGGIGGPNMSIELKSLQNASIYSADEHDRVIILTSDYYIKTIADKLKIPDDKLVFCNNFHMCCGEGICGACGHVDSKGNFSKMCKCRLANVQTLKV